MELKKRISFVVMVCILAYGVIGCTNTEVNETEQTTAFPTKNIRIVVPFAPGGGTDVISRVFADAAGGDYLNGYKIYVENISGGGATIGQGYVANTAERDGHTVMLFTSSAINNTILKGADYSYEDFKPLCGINPDPEILIVPKDSPFKNLKEFIEHAKKEEVIVSTPGHSTGHHIRAMRMEDEHGVKFKYVHNDSGAAQVQQVMGGHCDVAYMTVGEAVSPINDGAAIGLATMSKNRMEETPNVPTFEEAGYGEWIDGAYRGLAVHKDVPEDVYEFLVEEFRKIAESDKYKEGARRVGLIPGYDTPEEYQAYIDTTADTIKKLESILK